VVADLQPHVQSSVPILPGDIIVAVNGTDTMYLKFDQVIELLRSSSLPSSARHRTDLPSAQRVSLGTCSAHSLFSDLVMQTNQVVAEDLLCRVDSDSVWNSRDAERAPDVSKSAAVDVVCIQFARNIESNSQRS